MTQLLRAAAVVALASAVVVTAPGDYRNDALDMVLGNVAQQRITSSVACHDIVDRIKSEAEAYDNTIIDYSKRRGDLKKEKKDNADDLAKCTGLARKDGRSKKDRAEMTARGCANEHEDKEHDRCAKLRLADKRDFAAWGEANCQDPAHIYQIWTQNKNILEQKNKVSDNRIDKLFNNQKDAEVRKMVWLKQMKDDFTTNSRREAGTKDVITAMKSGEGLPQSIKDAAANAQKNAEDFANAADVSKQCSGVESELTSLCTAALKDKDNNEVESLIKNNWCGN